MTVQVVRASRADAVLIGELLIEYLSELSEFDTAGGIHARRYPYLERYWDESGRHAFTLQLDGIVVGFALVRAIHDAAGPSTQMAEFFVRTPYRGLGIGRKAAVHLFDAFRGRWLVSEMERNTNAQAFWRKVIAQYASQRYTERRADGRVIQEFTSL